jgi:hypothetical protein
MTNMKTTMYKTYQNSTNPDWQPHIAWREIIHVIIDPVSQQQNGTNEPNDLTQLACYGDTTTNFATVGSIPILHTTGDEYIRCINIRKNIILKAKRKLPRALSDANKHRPSARRMNSLDQQQLEDAISHSTGGFNTGNNSTGIGGSNSAVGGTTNASLAKRSKNLFKNVNRLRWGKNERHNLSSASAHQQQGTNNRLNSPTATTGLDESGMPSDAISLVSNLTF